MSMGYRLWASALIMAWVTGCSDSDSEPAAPAPIPGTWTGSFNGSETMGALTLTLAAGTAANEYVGSATVDGEDCFPSGEVTASMSGSDLHVEIRSMSAIGLTTMTLEGTVEGEEFSGDFTLRGDNCPDDDGSASLVKE